MYTWIGICNQPSDTEAKQKVCIQIYRLYYVLYNTLKVNNSAKSNSVVWHQIVYHEGNQRNFLYIFKIIYKYA